MQKMVTSYPVRITAIAWGLGLSAGYLIGKIAGGVVGRTIFHIPVAGLWEAENTGIAIGVAVGSLVSGFLTTFALQSKFQLRKAHLLIGTMGWLFAMLIGLVIISYLYRIFD